MRRIIVENGFIHHKELRMAVQMLQNGGVIIYPTDSVYGMACDSQSKVGYEKLCKVKGVKPHEAMFSLVCSDFKQISDHAHQIATPLFRIMKKNLPGPFTFIIKSGNRLPKTMLNRKQTIGVRFPDHELSVNLIELLGNPLMSTSLKSSGDNEVLKDPVIIQERYQHDVDVFIDDDMGGGLQSTVVDSLGGEIKIIRQGALVLKE